MYKTLVIVRHTFREMIVQPIFTLLLGLGAAIIIIYSMLPFFTLGEDIKMYKAVALDVIMLLALLATLFTASKSIFEEIEDRTMLTLMSKPVRRWQVLLGKYFGIILGALLAVAILGGVLVLCTWWRVPADYRLNPNSISDVELSRLFDLRMMHVTGLLFSFFLMWLQISVLAAISVAISTRVSLVVNIPVVILLYIAGNLTRFLFVPDSPLEGRSVITKGFAYAISVILPYLEAFDLRELTVFKQIAYGQFADDPQAVALSIIAGYVGIAVLYAVAYATFALAAGMWSFQNRELGGGEG